MAAIAIQGIAQLSWIKLRRWFPVANIPIIRPPIKWHATCAAERQARTPESLLAYGTGGYHAENGSVWPDKVPERRENMCSVAVDLRAYPKKWLCHWRIRWTALLPRVQNKRGNAQGMLHERAAGCKIIHVIIKLQPGQEDDLLA